MIKIKISVTFVTMAFLLGVLDTGKAYAYLDPGTGSYFFQLLLGALLGALFSVKIFWQKIKSFFTARFPRNKPRE